MEYPEVDLADVYAEIDALQELIAEVISEILGADDWPTH